MNDQDRVRKAFVSFTEDMKILVVRIQESEMIMGGIGEVVKSKFSEIYQYFTSIGVFAKISKDSISENLFANTKVLLSYLNPEL